MTPDWTALLDAGDFPPRARPALRRHSGSWPKSKSVGAMRSFSPASRRRRAFPGGARGARPARGAVLRSRPRSRPDRNDSRPCANPRNARQRTRRNSPGSSRTPAIGWIASSATSGAKRAKRLRRTPRAHAAPMRGVCPISSGITGLVDRASSGFALGPGWRRGNDGSPRACAAPCRDAVGGAAAHLGRSPADGRLAARAVRSRSFCAIARIPSDARAPRRCLPRGRPGELGPKPAGQDRRYSSLSSA